MENDLLEAIQALQEEKGIPAEVLAERIRNAIAVAIRRDMGCEDNAVINIDFSQNKFDVFIRKTIVETVTNPKIEITPEDAKRQPEYHADQDFVDIRLETKQFGRIAAQAAKHVIRQGIREAERQQTLERFRACLHEVVSARVVRVEPETLHAIVDVMGSELMLPRNEQIPDEVLTPGQVIKLYVVDVKETEKGPRAIISRVHPWLIRRLFEQEVKEIADGIVEIKGIAREAGSRTKIAVYSREANVDPVGACIGHKGARVSSIIEEISGEKIDIIKYSPLPSSMIAAALAPASVIDVEILDEENRHSRVIVPDYQLSLAIGNKGQNARLAAKLTGWRIDIHSDQEGRTAPAKFVFNYNQDFFSSDSLENGETDPQ